MLYTIKSFWVAIIHLLKKLKRLAVFFDNKAARIGNEDRTDWLRVLPFVLLHLGCFAVIWVGFSTAALTIAIVLYCLRIFAIGACYHRLLAHHTYKTHRWFQFLLAFIANTSAQRGPIWWAAHHRHHHQTSDQPDDPHSAKQHGFWYSHVGWFMSEKYFHYRDSLVKDLLKLPELRFLDRFDAFAPLVLAIALYACGQYLAQHYPHLETNGLQLLVWGFFISNMVVLHATLAINSVSHCVGIRRFETKDHSRNNWLLALVTFGEGWHNNHHHNPRSTRQGSVWWEFDLTYVLLKLLSKFRIVSDLTPFHAKQKH